MNKASRQLDYQLAIIYVCPLEKYLQLIMVKNKKKKKCCYIKHVLTYIISFRDYGKMARLS